MCGTLIRYVHVRTRISFILSSIASSFQRKELFSCYLYPSINSLRDFNALFQTFSWGGGYSSKVKQPDLQ
jgi:hypothetical protein